MLPILVGNDVGTSQIVILTRGRFVGRLSSDAIIKTAAAKLKTSVYS
jgi:hypothetical protein